jgi:transposase
VKPVWDNQKNHGRLSADDYTGCSEVVFSHPTLAPGSACPECAVASTLSKLQKAEPKVIVRLIGSPLITGTRYVALGLRCFVCDKRYHANFPAKIKDAPKYDVSCVTTLAIGRYSLGIPMYRTEQNQSMHNIPMKDSTQWDLLTELHSIVSPIYNVLVEESSNGQMVLYDDTTGRILENQSKGLATHTTAFISVHDEKKIHLFFTGQKHAGNNADAILAKRTTEEPVIAMMDASSKNIPKQMSAELTARFILCFCLVHGRRKFFEVLNFFDKECDFVLEIIGQVYLNEQYCKKKKLSPQERLHYHQLHSQPLMDSLYIWLNNQLLYELSENNSGLGEAVRYMLRHWIPLTTFLRVAGAPMDSSWAERIIKIAIRHRRNSLFYKTTNGAEVGDCMMSLISTAQQNGINPYDYLNTLQQYPEQVKASPQLWLPWNYATTMAAMKQAA